MLLTSGMNVTVRILLDIFVFDFARSRLREAN